MKLHLKAFVVFVLLSFNSVAAQAFDGGEALVTIRFNQPQVAYQDQLYNAVVEAVKTKASVRFNVVGYAPVANDESANSRYLQNTQYYAQTIANDLKKMGVNPQQVSFNVQSSPQVENEEVRIFVQ